jgi:oligopeptide/dipeptide ABC transporter ATP-binding protein
MLLCIKDLTVSYPTYRGVVHAVIDVCLDIDSEETVGVVGETGCGKSTLGLSVVRLVPKPGKIEDGEILFEEENLLRKNKEEMMKIRREKISMIFQDPTTSLNPVFRVGYQIAESLMIAKNLPKSEAMENAVELLSMVGIGDPEKVAKQYPHELSGGMKQRVMIAIALSTDSKLLIADEPTSSLDVTIQAQILDLMSDIKKKSGMSILLITHNMGVVAQTCDRVAVMYAGNIVEIAGTVDLYKKAMHPYTQGLLSAADLHKRKTRLQVIPGNVPNLIDVTDSCPFYPRCDRALDICKRRCSLVEVEPGHRVACHLFPKQA